MDKITFSKRTVWLFAAVVICIIICIFRLFNLQIVNGEEYLEKSERRLSRTYTVKAPRGEILDRYGRPLVTNRTSFTVKIEAVGWREADKPRLICDLINLCGQTGQEYIDTLPITKAAPFSYTYTPGAGESAEKNIAKYLTKNEWQADTAAQDLIRLICEDYEVDLEKYTPVQQRQIAGVLYEMEERNFSSQTPYTFAQDVDIALVTRIKEQIRSFPGVMIDVEPIREYQTQYAAHILGRVGQISSDEWKDLKKKGYKMNDTVGKEGMEKILEDYLRGTDGSKSIETTFTGKVTNVLGTVDPVLGNNCVLTLDIRLQEAAEQSLARIVPKLRAEGKTNRRWGGDNAKGAAAVVIDVRNGDVLASASYPTFSLQNYSKEYATLSKDKLTPYLNRAIAGTFAPGSTFKMITSLAALEAGVVKPDTKIVDEGIYTYYAPSYSPMCDVYKTYRRTHGPVNVSQAIMVSCNYYFYETGRLTGIDKIEETARRFGLGQATGIELPGERSGQVASRALRREKNQRWYDGDTLAAAIGQSDTLVTPIQLANYIAELCSGVRYKPHLLKSIKDASTNQTVYETQPEVLGTIDMDESFRDAILEGMHMGAHADDGTAAATFKNYPVQVATKTGSAQATGGSHAVFVSFAPYENPEIAVAVVVENGGQGSRIASVARDIYDVYFNNDFAMEKLQGENQILR